MRRIVLVLLLALSYLPARAQAPGTPEAQSAAKELLAIMSPDMIGQLTNSLIGQMWPQIERALSAKVGPEVMAEVRAEMESTLKTFVINATTNDAPVVYAKYFSAQELRDMAAFYKTPTGAKALRLLPQVTAEYFGIMMPRLEGFNRELQVRIQAILAKHGVK
ncbi:MAG: DUF2059 domain-containing protein [Xanthobacteraceae bacterium]|nr:DUF2059 domain-containing protein [Xanthobacteraceae bacterium]